MSDEQKIIRVVKSATDLQRLKLEKLMKNPEKPAFIPTKGRDKSFPSAPEFVRNVMGSSAGAGSGEFHVYRHIRRREYSRQEYLNQSSKKEKLDTDFHNKLEENARQTEKKAAKNRAKRQRAKQRIQNRKRNGTTSTPTKVNESSSSSSSSEHSDEEEKEEDTTTEGNSIEKEKHSNKSGGVEEQTGPKTNDTNPRLATDSSKDIINVSPEKSNVVQNTDNQNTNVESSVDHKTSKLVADLPKINNKKSLKELLSNGSYKLVSD